MIFPSARPSPPHHFSCIFLAVHDASPPNPVFSYSCGLFFSLCPLFDARLVCFQQFADSLCKTPGGVGYLCHISAPSAPARSSGGPLRYHLPLSCGPFIFIRLQIPPRRSSICNILCFHAIT